MQFLVKAVALQSIKKTGFNSKNNDKDSQPTYFRLANCLLNLYHILNN